MEIQVKQGGIQAVAADTIIINLFQGVTVPGGATGVVDKALDGAIQDLISEGDLGGKLGDLAVIYPRGTIPARRVIIVGLGKSESFDVEAVREASGVAIKQAQKLGAKKVASIVHGGGIGGLDLIEATQAVVEGSMLALYEYDTFGLKNDKEPKNKIDSLTLVEFDETKIEAIQNGAKIGQIIAESVSLARTLGNHPGNVATPTAIAKTAQEICTPIKGLECRVLDEEALRKEEMGLLLAVAQGASQPAQFIIMEYHPPQAQSEENGPIVLIGKGVAFDTGGYSIKSYRGMSTMKGDMAGAAAIMGAIRGIALLELPLHVIGLIPTLENVIGPMAYKPNDVFTAKNGLSVEIINTDAEGRLLLADTLCYADELKPSAVIDVATLTGSKITGLGNRTNALFTNDELLGQSLLKAGEKVGEPLWKMPLDSAYDRQLKSQVANLKNTGGRAAGSITAARFLSYFVGDWPWVHIDMAGSEFYKNGAEYTSRSYLTEGASGIPLRTLIEFLRNGGES